jgi:succinoglycan biosynthesis transport protein ExoP
MASKSHISVPPAPVNIAAMQPQMQVPVEEDQIDLRKYFRILRKRLWHILLITLIVLGAVTFYTLRLPRIYKATATVQIETRAPRVLGREVEEISELGTGSYWTNKEYYETQYKVIKSRDVATRVVKKLKLNSDMEFLYPLEMMKDPGFRGKTVSVKEGAKRLQAMVLVEPVKDSRLVQISIEHPNPSKAQLLANEIAEEYIDYNLEVVLESTINAVNWLSNQMETLQGELEGAEKNLYDFKNNENILSVSLEDRQNYLANEIQKISEGMAEIKMKRIELTAKKKQIETIPTDDPLSMPITPLLDNSLIQNLKSQYAQLTQEKVKMAEDHDVNWPAMKELTDIKKNIQREVDNIMKAIELQYQETLEAEKGYRVQLADLQDKALDMNLKEIQYNKLFREKENTEKLYSLVLSRTKEADLQKILKANNIRILDRAIKPEAPVKPRVRLNILLGLIIGLMGGIGLAFLLEYMDITIKTQEEVEQELGLTFLGIIPSIGSNASRKSHYYSLKSFKKRREHRRKGNGKEENGKVFNKDLFVLENPKSSVAECIRSIRTNILFKSAERPIRNILITSPAPQEGKTTVGISLAITMAQSGNRTLIVDTDMRRPRVHKAFNIPNTSGISSAILGIESLSQAIVPSGVENLEVLPCGPIPPNPAEILHTKRFVEIVGELSLKYDRIVFDSPPVVAVTDAVILSTICDGVLIVIRPLSTLKSAARQAKKQILDVGGNIVGVVFNDLDLENRQYGYYHYYYSRKYGYYSRYEDARDSTDDATSKPKGDYSVANEP